MSDEVFVDALENQVMPEIADLITELEAAGVQDAPNALRRTDATYPPTRPSAIRD